MIISKNTKIFLTIFTLILLCITVGAIFYKNSQKEKENGSHVIIESADKVPAISDDDIYEQNTSESSPLSLSDTYSNNNLEYEIIEDNSKGINISYIQISGLQDDSVQDSINEQIKERINKIVDSNNFRKNSDETAYIKTTIEANFSDVLSIKIFARFKEDYNKCYGLNFRLDNGERIKFNDLFTYSAPKKNIITSSAYRTFALDYYTDEGISNEFYTNIEDDLVNFLDDYNNGKVTEFSFTPLTIDLYKNGKTVTIDMTKYYKYIAIYDKFVSKTNLYNNATSQVATNIPVFVKRPKCIYDLYEKINDTCYLDVIIYSDEELSTRELKVVSNYEKNLEDRLKDLRNERGLYYSNYVKVRKDKLDGENILVFEENECYALVRENNFNDQVYNKIITAQRDINNLDSDECKIYVLEKGMLQASKWELKYNTKTGLEINDEEDDEETGNGSESGENNHQEGSNHQNQNDSNNGNEDNNQNNNVSSQEGNNQNQEIATSPSNQVPTPSPSSSVSPRQPSEESQTPTPSSRPSSQTAPTPGNITTQVIF